MNDVIKIYLLTNSVNGKMYVGQTTEGIKRRMQKGYPNNPMGLYGDMQVHHFDHRVLKECSTQDDADYWERYYICLYHTTDDQTGYNSNSGGKSGWKISEKSIASLSDRMLEWHANNPHPMLGRKHTEEAKSKISQSGMGRVMSEESIKKRCVTVAKNSEIGMEKEQEIIELYNTNLSLIDIRHQSGVDLKKIYKTLKKYDVKLRGKR